MNNYRLRISISQEMYFVCTPYYGKEDIELSKYKGLDWWQNIERAHRNV